VGFEVPDPCCLFENGWKRTTSGSSRKKITIWLSRRRPPLTGNEFGLLIGTSLYIRDMSAAHTKMITPTGMSRSARVPT
jgi:hypothetical protein